MNVSPAPRDEGSDAPFAPGGTWEGSPADPSPHHAAPPHGPAFDGGSVGGPAAAPGSAASAGGRYPLAGWGSRAVARLIDWVVVGIPAGFVAMLVGFVWSGAQTMIAGYGSTSVGENFWLIFGVCAFIVFAGYDSVCVKRWRRTFGKRLMGLEVAPVGAGGSQGPIPVASMVARSALLSLMFLVTWSDVLQVIVFLLVLVFIALWPLFDSQHRQGVHDKLAGTVVIRTGWLRTG